MRKKIKIIADDKIPFLRGALDSFAEISYLPPAQITNGAVKNFDALIIRTRTKCDAKLLENSSVKFIATATIGYDHIDTGYCESKGIKWINAPGCNSSSVRQYIAASLITLAKEKDCQLNSKTIGIIGVGNVGSKVEEIAKIFGMNVLLNDPPRERNERNKNFISLDYIIENSDIITFHVPLNLSGIDQTYHLADEQFFSKFNNPKVFINTSRGEVVLTSALKNAINNRKINFCTLDVWENEPEIDKELLNFTDIATPHIAGYSVEGKANGTAACVKAVNQFFNLGLTQNWYPTSLPASNTSKEIKVDCTGKNKQEILSDCINSTYKIKEDDERLRIAVHDFEKQRSSYPARREFSFYNVQLNHADESIKTAINELGFNIINNKGKQ